MEIDLDGHGGGNPRGAFGFTLTATEIATGWTETRTVRSKAQVHVVAAVADVLEPLQFPIRGIDTGNDSQWRGCPVNARQCPLLSYCSDKGLTLTRSRSGNKNKGAHV